MKSPSRNVQESRQETFAGTEFAESFQRSSDLILSGKSEFYTIGA